MSSNASLPNDYTATYDWFHFSIDNVSNVNFKLKWLLVNRRRVPLAVALDRQCLGACSK